MEQIACAYAVITTARILFQLCPKPRNVNIHYASIAVPIRSVSLKSSKAKIQSGKTLLQNKRF